MEVVPELLYETLYETGYACHSADQNIPNARGLCVQNFRPRDEAWQLAHLHHVLAGHQFKHLYATVLQLEELGEVFYFPLLILFYGKIKYG